MLEKANADVLLLYDCCHSAATRISSSMVGYNGVTEVISACGYETIAPPVCEHSFSRALTQILASASQGQPFSVGQLHGRVLEELMCWSPSLVQDQDGKFIKGIDGRLASERQPRRTPIYTIICETEPRRSIILAPLKPPPSISESSKSSDDATHSIAIPSKLLVGQKNPVSKRKRSSEEGLNTSYDLKQQRLTEKEIEYPQVLLTIRLESDTFDKAAWLEWLRAAPPECKDIKIEGRYDSFSTLLLVRMPVATWNLLPENAAYSFVGFVTSENKACDDFNLDIPIPIPELNAQMPTFYDSQEYCESGESSVNSNSSSGNSPSPTQLASSHSDGKGSAKEFQAAIATSSYIYSALSPDLYEIRVLELQPDISDSSPIKVRLLTVLLSDRPDYNALSYVWGDSREKVLIFVDGKEFQITRNLYSALKRLRLQNLSLLLWVDAICINQEDVTERNFQVRLMKQVYSQARQVIVWLGEAKDDSDLAMDLIKTWVPFEAKKMSMAQLLETVLPAQNAFDIRSWNAARRLFARAYWHRASIFQEIVFSNEAKVICGSKHVFWRDLSIVQVKWQQLKSDSENSYLLDSEQRETLRLPSFSAVSTISLHHVLQRRHDFPRSIFQLLSSTGASHATDPRDKIYALLGFEEISVLELEPDYGMPVHRVYCTQDSCKLISRGSEDWIFCSRLELDAEVLSHSLTSHQDTLAMTKVSGYLRKLTARGIIFDVITEFDSSRTEEHNRIRSRWLDLALSHKVKHPSGIPQLQAYFRTVVADDTGLGSGKPGFRDEESQRSFFTLAAGMMYLLREMALDGDYPAFRQRRRNARSMLESANYIWKFVIWNQQLPSSMTMQDLSAPFLDSHELKQDSQIQWPKEDHDDDGWRRDYEASNLFLERQKFTCRKRSFFMTAKGYMGLAPLRIHTDDLVCILLGCDMPLIIRKAGECYVLVGHAYIYGLMNGEALQDVHESKLEDIEFE